MKNNLHSQKELPTNRPAYNDDYETIEQMKPQHNRMIENLDLHKNIVDACLERGIKTISELCRYDEDEVKEWHGIGPKLTEQIQKKTHQWAKAQTEETTHIVMLSGGIGSWFTGKRVVHRHGKENTIALFADTSMEDEDTYKFLEACAKDIGIELNVVRDGRTPWDVFFDQGFIGNSRVDNCSRTLKREKCAEWLEENYNPFNVICYLGIDWTERHRIEKTAPLKLPWIYKAPLTEEPYIRKEQMIEEASKADLPTQKLYEMGFPHANCGGFCVRAGQAHFKHLYEQMPERYAFHERKEQEFREQHGDHSILRIQKDGEKKNLTLKELREEHIEGSCEIDENDWGGCGCFSDVSG